MKPTIIIGSDHGGYQTKQAVMKALAKEGYTIVDIGGYSPKKPDDYPDYAKEVAKTVAKGKNTMGVLVCGTGTGMVMAANKVKGARAAMIYDAYSARMARHDNDANIAALRGRKFLQKKAIRITKMFLRTEFSKIPRHKRRIKKIEK